MHDLIISNATLIDGTGADAFSGSLAVSDGKIAALSKDPTGADLGETKETLDAGGLCLAPGIIDSHTHYDAQITWDQTLSPSPEHGITSVVIGNCGFTIAPCRDDDRDLTMRNLTQVEGMSLEALRQGIQWDFTSFPDYMGSLEKRGSIPNVAAFVGHSAIRTWVMGEDAVTRNATPDEVAEMAAIVEEAMEVGAIGFATSTSAQHNGDQGIPMPSRLADDAEMQALANAMAKKDRGIFMLTRGSDTSIEFLEQISADTGRPMMIAALLYNSANPQASDQALTDIEAANDRGRDVYAQVSCCPLSMEFDMRSPYVFEGFKAWQPAMLATDHEARKAVYMDPAFRQAVREELARPEGVRLFNGEWDKLQVLHAKTDTNSSLETRSLEDIAKERGQDPLDCILDLALSEDFETEFLSLLLNYDDAPVGHLLTHPNSSIALSDAGAHLTFFCDVGFGLHLLSYWTRDRKLMSIEKAVHALTGRTAQIYGISDRGLLQSGMAADLLLFDPNTVARSANRRAYDLPGGHPRLVSDPSGVHGVWVNGVRVVREDGSLIDDVRPGQLLKDFAA